MIFIRIFNLIAHKFHRISVDDVILLDFMKINTNSVSVKNVCSKYDDAHFYNYTKIYYNNYKNNKNEKSGSKP